MYFYITRGRRIKLHSKTLASDSYMGKDSATSNAQSQIRVLLTLAGGRHRHGPHFGCMVIEQRDYTVSTAVTTISAAPATVTVIHSTQMSRCGGSASTTTPPDFTVTVRRLTLRTSTDLRPGAKHLLRYNLNSHSQKHAATTWALGGLGTEHPGELAIVRASTFTASKRLASKVYPIRKN